MSSLEVVEYDDRWEAAHTAFATAQWPNKHRRRDPAYLRWKFRGPRHGPVPGLLLAVVGDEVRGQIGLLPGAVRLGPDRPVEPCQWICEMMVAPEHRREGITTALGEVALPRPVVTLGPDPSSSAAPTLTRMGLGYTPCSVHMVLPLKVGPVVARRYPQVERAQRLVSLAGSPLLRVRHRSLATAARQPDAGVCSWRDLVALVADQEAHLDLPHAVHDEAFMAWRCAGLDGWVRECDAVRTRRGSFAVVERRGTGLNVSHWHAVDDDDALALFGRVLYMAKAYGSDLIETYATGAEQGQLAALGFLAQRTPVEMYSWPHDVIADAGGTFAYRGYDSDYGL